MLLNIYHFFHYGFEINVAIWFPMLISSLSSWFGFQWSIGKAVWFAAPSVYNHAGCWGRETGHTPCAPPLYAKRFRQNGSEMTDHDSLARTQQNESSGSAAGGGVAVNGTVNMSVAPQDSFRIIQHFSNYRPRTTCGPRDLPLWSF